MLHPSDEPTPQQAPSEEFYWDEYDIERSQMAHEWEDKPSAVIVPFPSRLERLQREAQQKIGTQPDSW